MKILLLENYNNELFYCVFFRMLRIRVYIKEGWDQQFLVDPEGKVAEKKRYQAKNEVQKFHER